MINATMAYKRLNSLLPAATEKMRRIPVAIWKALSFSVADDRIAPKESLCISIEKGGISVAAGSRLFSRYRIKAFRQYPAEESGQYPRPEKAASLAAASLADFKAGKAETIMCIPREWTIFQIADFPATVRENLPDAVSYELDRLTPLSPENAYYDYRVTGEREERLCISLTVANAEFVNRYLDAFRDKGVAVGVVTSETSAINALLRHIDASPRSPVSGYALKLRERQTPGFRSAAGWLRSLPFRAKALRQSLKSRKANIIYLKATDHAYELFLSAGGTIVSSHSGVAEAQDGRATGDAVAAEINRMAAALRARGKGMDFVASFNDVAPLELEERLSVPVRALRDADLKIVFTNRTGEVPHTAVGGVMESLSPQARGANLLSRGRHEREKTPLLATAVLALALFVIGIANLVMPLQMDEQRLHTIERQMAGLKEEVNKAEALQRERDRLDDEISTISGFKEDNPMTLAIIKDITAILPRSAWLTKLRITDKTVDIEGYASVSPADLLPKLEASRYLQKVEFASPTVKDTRMNADRFVFKMEIEDAEEIEEPVQKKDETQKK